MAFLCEVCGRLLQPLNFAMHWAKCAGDSKPSHHHKILVESFESLLKVKRDFQRAAKRLDEFAEMGGVPPFVEKTLLAETI